MRTMRKLLLSFIVVLTVCWSQTAHAQQIGSDQLRIADHLSIDGKDYVLGQNLITNPSFNKVDESGNITGWTVGTYAAMTTSNFNWLSSDGHDGGACIRSRSSNGAAGAGSIGTRWSIEPGKKYYFRYWIKGVTTGNVFVPVLSITDAESTKGGENEYMDASNHGRTMIGKNGQDPDSKTLGNSNANADGSWCLTSIVFDATDTLTGIEARYLQFNARWLGNIYYFDDFYLGELIDAETADLNELQQLADAQLHTELTDNITSLMTQANTLITSLTEYPGLSDELNDVVIDEPDLDEDDNATLQEFYDRLFAAVTLTENGYESAQQLTAKIKEAQQYLETTSFPGADALSEAMEKAEDFDAGHAGSAQEYIDALAELSAAIEAYINSQEASPEHPADYSYLVKHPFFVSDDAAPSISATGTYIYPNGANYTNGSKPSDANSEGWYTGTSGGDQRVNYVQGRTCWNAWRTNFDYVSINQNLTDLPNGYYKVSADVITQPGCVTDQHAFATSSLYSVSSPVLSTEGWVYDAPYNGTWETLTTETLIVTDGKLTIGVYGTGDKLNAPSVYGGTNTDLRRGWFCATNFRLYYMGQTSEADLGNIYAEQLKTYQAEADTLKLAADKAAYEQVIAQYPAIQTQEEMTEAFAALNAARATARQSETAYKTFTTGIMATLSTAVSDGTYTGNAASIANRALDNAQAYLNSVEATYTALADMTASLNALNTDYLPALTQLENLSLTDAAAIAARQATIDPQVAELTQADELPSTDHIEALTEALQNALTITTTTELIVSGATDYTPLLVNPTIDDNRATGWTVNRIVGDGNNAKSGQQFDGQSGYYMDSYQATTGRVRYTASQTVSNIPNGIYRVRVMNRVTGDTGKEGVYVFASATPADTLFAPAHHEYFNYQEWVDKDMIDQLPTDEDGNTITAAYIEKIYGEVWAEAAQYIYENPETTSGQQYNIWSANNCKGWGWFYTEVDCEVTNHEITLGITTDSILTLGHTDTQGEACVPFSGTWFSADNWTLTLLSNKEADYNPATGIADIQAAPQSRSGLTDGIYDLSGRRVGTRLSRQLPKGIYIVHQDGRTQKVFIK